jgi:hypothetical protein
MGDSGTGKTYALRTLIEAGITPFILFTEPGMEVLGDLDPSSYHFNYITAPESNWTGLIDTAEKVNKFNFDALTKMQDMNRSRYGQFAEVLRQCNNFTDSRTGESFGDASTWGTDRALVLDSLSGLSDMAMRLVVGGKPTRAMQDWMVAQNLLKSFLDQCTNQLRCWFIVIAHLEREKDEITGGTQIMVSTLGRALAPKIPMFFSDAIQTLRQGSEFTWDTAGMNIAVKARNVPIGSKLPPSFVPLVESWKKRGGVIEAPAS